MENKEPVSEFASTADEWKELSTKTFRQVNKSLGTKGRIAVIFGIAIVWLLGSVLAHMGDRYDRGFDRDYGNMRQGREFMMGNSRGGDDQFQGRNLRGLRGTQGCSQQAILEIDPANTNGFFDRMESRMQQLFGIDQKGKTQTEIQIPAPSPITVEVVTGSNK